MFLHIVVLAVMAVLYGLAWHNQPAKDDKSEGRKGEGTARPFSVS